MTVATQISLTTAALARPADIAGEIDNTYWPAIEALKTASSWSILGCRVEDWKILGRDPVKNENRAVNVSLYLPHDHLSSKGSIIILPPTGGVNILDRGYANELCTSGFSVALISGWEFKEESGIDLSMHDHGALRAIAATRHVVEFLRTRAPSPIGLLGTSIGAIAGTLVLGFEPRISSAVLIVGSARFADVIAESDEAGATTLRDNRMQISGLKTLEDYREAVRSGVRIEPSLFVGRVGLKRSLVTSADADTTVPSAFQWELAEILKSEVHLRLKGNHLAAIKSSFCDYRKTFVKFFEETLAGERR